MVGLDPPGSSVGLARLDDASLAATFEPFTDPKYRQELRLAALDGWRSAAPDDAKLAQRLRQFSADRNRQVREEAIRRLTALHHAEDLALFRKLSEDSDPTVAELGRAAIDEIEAFTIARERPGEGASAN
jgi:hypothetical protein